MEEESVDLHSEENKVLPDKNMKRKLKTPSQVEALERFYSEHKYPTESLKLELAEKIGLTEKQVSGWFCHRRLKDKRLLQEEAHGNGKQDRSSGVIQDRGSGLRQDSCGSTKQGDYGLLDPREVESRSLYGEELEPANLNYEQRRHYSGDLRVTDDSSSETSSPLHDTFLHHNENSCDMGAKKYLAQPITTMPVNASGVKDRGNIRPSGYLKVKSDLENSAITAVKRQLGRHYREDGPSLGVKFQPLPPGAFDLPITAQVNAESYHSCNPILPKSSNIPGIHKQHNLSMRYGGPHPKMTSLDSHMEGRDIEVMEGPDRWDDYSSHQSKQKSSLPNYSNPSASRNYSADRNENPIREMSSYSSSRNNRMRSKHDAEGMRSDFISDHSNYLYNGKLPSEQMEPRFDNYDNIPKNVLKRERFSCKPSNMIDRCSKFPDTVEREPSRRIAKEEKLYGERRTMKERHDPVLHSTSETRLAKRVSDDLRRPEYVMKTPFMEMPPQTNQIEGSAVDMPSSFSEDETAETSASMD